MAEPKRCFSGRELLPGALSGTPTTMRLLDDLLARRAERERAREAAQAQLREAMTDAAHKQDEKAWLAAQARAHMEADGSSARWTRSTRSTAFAHTRRSCRNRRRRARGARRGTRGSHDPDDEHLVRITWALVALGALTLVATVVAVLAG